MSGGMVTLIIVGVLVVGAALLLLLSVSGSGKRTARAAEAVAVVVEKDEEFSPEVIAYASKPGGFVLAIKRYRLETGASLDVAKPKIERLAARLRVK